MAVQVLISGTWLPIWTWWWGILQVLPAEEYMVGHQIPLQT